MLMKAKMVGRFAVNYVTYAIKGWLAIAAIYLVKWSIDFVAWHYDRVERKEQKKALRAAEKAE